MNYIGWEKVMNDYTRILILLFAVMFFWVLNTPAFAQEIIQCFDNGNGLITCIRPDGSTYTIVKV